MKILYIYAIKQVIQFLKVKWYMKNMFQVTLNGIETN